MKCPLLVELVTADNVLRPHVVTDLIENQFICGLVLLLGCGVFVRYKCSRSHIFTNNFKQQCRYNTK